MFLETAATDEFRETEALLCTWERQVKWAWEETKRLVLHIFIF